MAAFKGRAKCIPADPDAIFLPYQARWIKDKSRLKLMEKSRQVGLSWCTAYDVNEEVAGIGKRYDEWITSRDDIQARLFLEDAKLWAGVMNMAANDLGEHVLELGNGEKATAYVLKFANGRRLYSMSSNPDAQAGKRGGRTLDEFALHKDQRKLWSIAYPGITWGGSLRVISTHRGSNSLFNSLVREVREKGNPKKISLHRVTLQDALEQGFLFKLQQALPADAEQQAMTEADYFDFVKAGCVDAESFEQEYQCVAADDDSKFIEYELLTGCEYLATDRWERSLDDPVIGQLYAGVDIGRTKDLTVLWVVEKLGDVFYTRHVEKMERMRKSDQEKILWPWFARCDRICIDATGLGIGWVDDAQDKFGHSRVEGVTFTGPVKEALAYPVKGAMEDRKVRIPDDPAIRGDFRKLKKVTTSAGNIRFVAENDDATDGHADRFWALALAIHAGSSAGAPLDWTPGLARARGMDVGAGQADEGEPDELFAERGAW